MLLDDLFKMADDLNQRYRELQIKREVKLYGYRREIEETRAERERTEMQAGEPSNLKKR